MCFSVFVGGVFFTFTDGALDPAVLRWLYATLFTGIGLASTDIPAGAIWFRQLRGLATMVKLVLLLTTLLWPVATMPILFFVLVMSSIVSHMPGRYRYWVVGRGPGPSSGGSGMMRG